MSDENIIQRLMQLDARIVDIEKTATASMSAFGADERRELHDMRVLIDGLRGELASLAKQVKSLPRTQPDIPAHIVAGIEPVVDRILEIEGSMEATAAAAARKGMASMASDVDAAKFAAASVSKSALKQLQAIGNATLEELL